MASPQPQQTHQIADIYSKAFKEGRAAVKELEKRLSLSVPNGVKYDQLNNISYNNVVYQRDKIPDRILKIVERRNPVVAAGITLRIQQALEYSNISHDKDVPGWEFVPRDEKQQMTPKMEKQKLFLEYFIEKGHSSGYTSFDGVDEPSPFRERITQYVRDRILIDKVCWEIERDLQGRAIALWTLDGATVFPVLPGGFWGSCSMITAGMGGGYTELAEKIRQARLTNVPPVEKIAFVQELLYGMSGGGIAAAFSNKDMIYDISNDLNDVRYYKQGFSVIEKANIAITAFINSLSFNSNGLSRGAIPKVALAMGADSGYTEEQLEDLQDEWMANFEGVDSQWNIPILNGDAKVLQLLPNNRDMEYQQYLEFTGALTFACMGIDPTECGLRFNQATQIMSENSDGKQKFSKNRGLAEILTSYAYTVNKFIELSGYDFASNWNFRFNGLSFEDKGFEADLRKKAIETDTTINESRIKRGEKPVKYGDIICNPQFIQYVMQKEQQEQQSDSSDNQNDFSDEEGNDDDSDLDSTVDDAMDEAFGSDSANKMEKAFRLI